MKAEETFDWTIDIHMKGGRPMQKYINMDEFVCESEDSHEIIGGRSYRWRYVPIEYAAVQK